jgi:hypothetical protein
MKVVLLDDQSKCLSACSTTTVYESVAFPGPAGPPGPAGASANVSAHVHTQAIAAAVWTMNHNLGRRPHVTLLSVGGVEFDGDIVHSSNNQAIAYFESPMAGSAEIS